jgi:hypothetical protein
MVETKKKTLVVCPDCEIKGFKSILGEIGTDGDFLVQRFHQGFTIIESPQFNIVCGKCHGTAYIRSENPDDKIRVYFQQTEVSIGTLLN